ncbi:MAG: glutamate synthase central domain-containing protein, partial [Candidatus Omnitrophica bacterium]|nr:glutamate synthase central domain-containing protein [Candidatus Omnitrophota bacterium]
MRYPTLPVKQGLYDPRFEHDSCGVGFVCNIKGVASSEIVRQGLDVLNRLSHRGATGADPKTGDGAGVLIQLPHEFLLKVCEREKIILPAKGEYGAGLIFLPTNKKERDLCKDLFQKISAEEGQAVLGWRSVPVDYSDIGVTARETAPFIEHVFIGKGGKTDGGLDFERKLYMIRKRVESAVNASKLKQRSSFYITNLSHRTLSYKGLLMPSQVGGFFLDLKDESLKSAICLVHSRYSTNTFPTWNLSQPFRFLAHNGEINTLRGNINWMRARESLLESGLFGKDIKKLYPIIVPGGSDSASLDNIFELLVLAGRSMPHAMMMLIPAAWEQNNQMSEKVKNFYKYHSCVTEPWDGPAAIAFTDGTRIGACLDRNGLRPARYIVTKKDFVVMASEVGVIDISPEDIVASGRLEPGKTFYIDTELGRIIDDGELKDTMASHSPYAKWLKEGVVELTSLPKPKKIQKSPGDLLTSLKAFTYTREDLKVLIAPMAEKGAEPIGSMGNDTPHAVLSSKPQLLYAYFKQLFAQVTNPAIDPIREELVMSLESYIGPEKNLLSEGVGHCHRLHIERPILTNEELAKIRDIKFNGFTTKTIPILFNIADRKDFTKALDRVCAQAADAITKGYKFIILSDRGANKKMCALPALLATGAVHQYLVKRSLRTRIGIVIESAEPREVHHFALLFGYGADCVNPYLAYEAVRKLIEDGDLDLDLEKARNNYIKAVTKGILKILSKMGISTLQSYRGAQIFEAIGLNDRVIEKCFDGTASRIGGAGFDVLYKECALRHKEAYSKSDLPYLATGGVYQWKKDGEFHLWNPDTIAALQDAVRFNDYKKYREFASLINDQSGNPCTLRSMLKFKSVAPIPISEVESREAIFKRLATGAMSFGSISRAAHETLAIAMNRMGGRSNTGEGGEDPARFAPLPNGDSNR